MRITSSTEGCINTPNGDTYLFAATERGLKIAGEIIPWGWINAAQKFDGSSSPQIFSTILDESQKIPWGDPTIKDLIEANTKMAKQINKLTNKLVGK